MIQQRVHEEMLNAINQDMTFSFEGDKEEWTAEAFKWRLPYWDWSSQNPQIPSIFQTQSIEIREPKTADGKIPLPMIIAENPLNRFLVKVDGKPVPMGQLPKPYKLDNNIYGGKQCPVRYSSSLIPFSNKRIIPLTILQWSQCSGTSRWGLTGEFGQDLKPDQSQGVNNWKPSYGAIQKHAWYGDDKDKGHAELSKKTVSDLVYRLLASVTDWDAFSTTKFRKDNPTEWTDYVNLEYIHNNLHVSFCYHSCTSRSQQY